jgi:hypothetical protein
MTTDMAPASWVMLVSLGAFHGVNPGMGWLFAVALGMQERRRGAVLRALLPLGAGHALAIAATLVIALTLDVVVAMRTLRWVIAGVLVGLGLMRFVRHRHPRWVGMRVSLAGLTLWSFLMASAHGAGMMVVPFVSLSIADGSGHAHHHMAAAETTATMALLAAGVHAVSYLAVTAFIALLVFEKLGVGILRRAWFNLDLIWTAALLATGAATLMM